MRWAPNVLVGTIVGVVAVGGSIVARGQAPGVVSQTPEDAATTSLAAAVAIFDANPDPGCVVGEAKVCVRSSSTPEQAARGIARFGVSGSGPEGIGGFLGILGRDPAGAWQFWFGTQQATYQLLTLPGPMTVCADGDGLNVRALPSIEAEVLATLPDLTRVMAERFTLTQPGRFPPPSAGQEVEAGWYYLGAPVVGWSPSLYLENAALEGGPAMQLPCAFRNLFVQP